MAESVSVIVVSYNTRDTLRRCLSNLGNDHEVIVVDNASGDGSPEMVSTEFPHVHLIANAENRGFGAANNQGAAVANSALLLFLNSDAFPKPGAIDQLASVFEDPGVVAAGARLLNPDGSLQDSCANELTLWAVFCEQFYLEKLFPQGTLFSPYWVTRKLAPETKPQKVEQVMGACLMVQRDLPPSPACAGRDCEAKPNWGGGSGAFFDERYFLYCEDTDLCYRLRRAGEILYVPQAEVVHELGTSSSKERWKSVARYNRGKELYFEIHHGWFAWAVCLKLNRLGALFRLLAWSLPTLLTLGLITKFRLKTYLFTRVLFCGLRGPK